MYRVLMLTLDKEHLGWVTTGNGPLSRRCINDVGDGRTTHTHTHSNHAADNGCVLIRDDCNGKL